MATSRTRDGLTLSYTYDSANRLLDPHRQIRGALMVTFAILDSASLQNGVAVERFTGSEWVALPAQELLIGCENDASELKVLVKEGCLRESSYRVRLTSSLRDKQGRGLAQAQTFTLRIAVRGLSSDFSKTFAVDYESAVAAVDTFGGRFPGGQNSLFQGLWTDPVTGISYGRARIPKARCRNCVVTTEGVLIHSDPGPIGAPSNQFPAAWDFGLAYSGSLLGTEPDR